MKNEAEIYFESNSAVLLWSSVIGFQTTEAACGAHSVEALTLGGPVFLEAHTAAGDAKAAQRGYIALWKGRRECARGES